MKSAREHRLLQLVMLVMLVMQRVQLRQRLPDTWAAWPSL